MSNSVMQTLWNRRDRLNIMAEIMEATKRNQLKTRIMYKANLSFDQVNKYLELLLLRGFIKAGDPIRDQELARYKLTKRGLEILKVFETRHLILR